MFTGLITSFSQFAATATAAPCKIAHGGSVLLPTWYKYLPSEMVAGKCTPIFIFPDDISKILLALVEILFRVAALIAVGYVIYGGYRFILSQGEPEHTNAARNTIINALIGLAITIMATAIVTFIFSKLATY